MKNLALKKFDSYNGSFKKARQEAKELIEILKTLIDDIFKKYEFENYELAVVPKNDGFNIKIKYNTKTTFEKLFKDKHPMKLLEAINKINLLNETFIEPEAYDDDMDVEEMYVSLLGKHTKYGYSNVSFTVIKNDFLEEMEKFENAIGYLHSLK